MSFVRSWASVKISLQWNSWFVLIWNTRLNNIIIILQFNQAPGWCCSSNVFTVGRLSHSWRTGCGLERCGNTARPPLVAVGHMTLVFRWPRRTVFKIISFLSLCFTLFYNWSSSSPTPRAHATDEYHLVHRQSARNLPSLHSKDDCRIYNWFRLSGRNFETCLVVGCS